MQKILEFRALSLFIVLSSLAISTSAFGKALTKADARLIVPEGQYIVAGNSAKKVGALPAKRKVVRKIKVTHLNKTKPGKSGRQPASERAHAKATKKGAPLRRLEHSAKKNSRSPSSLRKAKPSIQVKKSKPVLQKPPKPSHGSSAREPDAFDLHSGFDPIRGT